MGLLLTDGAIRIDNYKAIAFHSPQVQGRTQFAPTEAFEEILI
jgi:hypothetical protein